MSSPRLHDFMVGLTVIIGVVSLATVLVLFGWLPAFLEDNYVLHVDLADATGLGRGSRVRLRGIDVGEVTSVELDPQSPRGVVARLFIQRERLVPVGSVARAEAPLLGGLPALTLVPPTGPEAAKAGYLPTDGSARVNGNIGSVTDRIAQEMSQALGGFGGRFTELNEQFRRIADNADRLGREVEALGREWTKVGSNVNQMLEPRSPQDVDSGKATGNLASAMARADAGVRELNATVAELRRWVDDEGLRADVKATVTQARQASEKLNAGAGQVQTLTQEARQSLADLSAKYGSLADDLKESSAALRAVALKADQGKGSVGKALNDPSLYDNLNTTVERMGAAVLEMKMLVEKWNREGLPLKLK